MSFPLLSKVHNRGRDHTIAQRNWGCDWDTPHYVIPPNNFKITSLASEKIYHKSITNYQGSNGRCEHVIGNKPASNFNKRNISSSTDTFSSQITYTNRQEGSPRLREKNAPSTYKGKHRTNTYMYNNTSTVTPTTTTAQRIPKAAAVELGGEPLFSSNPPYSPFDIGNDTFALETRQHTISNRRSLLTSNENRMISSHCGTVTMNPHLQNSNHSNINPRSSTSRIRRRASSDKKYSDNAGGTSMSSRRQSRKDAAIAQVVQDMEQRAGSSSREEQMKELRLTKARAKFFAEEACSSRKLSPVNVIRDYGYRSTVKSKSDRYEGKEEREDGIVRNSSMYVTTGYKAYAPGSGNRSSSSRKSGSTSTNSNEKIRNIIQQHDTGRKSSGHRTSSARTGDMQASLSTIQGYRTNSGMKRSSASSRREAPGSLVATNDIAGIEGRSRNRLHPSVPSSSSSHRHKSKNSTTYRGEEVISWDADEFNNDKDSTVVRSNRQSLTNRTSSRNNSSRRKQKESISKKGESNISVPSWMDSSEQRSEELDGFGFVASDAFLLNDEQFMRSSTTKDQALSGKNAFDITPPLGRKSNKSLKSINEQGELRDRGNTVFNRRHSPSMPSSDNRRGSTKSKRSDRKLPVAEEGTIWSFLHDAFGAEAEEVDDEVSVAIDELASIHPEMSSLERFIKKLDSDHHSERISCSQRTPTTVASSNTTESSAFHDRMPSDEEKRKLVPLERSGSVQSDRSNASSNELNPTRSKAETTRHRRKARMSRRNDMNGVESRLVANKSSPSTNHNSGDGLRAREERLYNYNMVSERIHADVTCKGEMTTAPNIVSRNEPKKVFSSTQTRRKEIPTSKLRRDQKDENSVEKFESGGSRNDESLRFLKSTGMNYLKPGRLDHSKNKPKPYLEQGSQLDVNIDDSSSSCRSAYSSSQDVENDSLSATDYERMSLMRKASSPASVIEKDLQDRQSNKEMKSTLQSHLLELDKRYECKQDRKNDSSLVECTSSTHVRKSNRIKEGNPVTYNEHFRSNNFDTSSGTNPAASKISDSKARRNAEYKCDEALMRFTSSPGNSEVGDFENIYQNRKTGCSNNSDHSRTNAVDDLDCDVVESADVRNVHGEGVDKVARAENRQPPCNPMASILSSIQARQLVREKRIELPEESNSTQYLEVAKVDTIDNNRPYSNPMTSMQSSTRVHKQFDDKNIESPQTVYNSQDKNNIKSEIKDITQPPSNPMSSILSSIRARKGIDNNDEDSPQDHKEADKIKNSHNRSPMASVLSSIKARANKEEDKEDNDKLQTLQSNSLAEGNNQPLALKDDPMFAKYFKMLKVGIPLPAVKQAMLKDELDPSILDGDFNKPAPRSETESLSAKGLPLKDDPKYSKYFKMIKIGIPLPAVKQAMVKDGLDPNIIDGNPNEPASLESKIPLKDDPKYSKYLKMISIGLPKGAAQQAMMKDGLDPSVLDGDLNLPAISSSTAKNQKIQPKKPKDKHRRTRLHWDSLHEEVISSNSVWAMVNDDKDIDDIHIDEAEFENLFKADISANKKQSTSPQQSRKSSIVKVIDPKRANNGGIILARIKLTYEEIATAIERMDDTVMSAHQMESMLEYFPTNEERRNLKAYLRNGKESDLCECEKFMVSMLRLPNPEPMTTSLIFKATFDSVSKAVENDALLVEAACEELLASIRLRKLLGIVLNIGNRLNTAGSSSSTSRVGAFSLDSLLKLNHAKAVGDTTKKMTFLHYVVMVVRRNNHSLLSFYEDLPSISKAQKINLDLATLELEKLGKNLDQAKTLALQVIPGKWNLKNNNYLSEEETDNVLGNTGIGRFVLEASSQIQSITDLYERTSEVYAKLLDYFGESKKMTKPHELFAIFVSFCNTFKSVVEEVDRVERAKAREEKKRQQKENPPKLSPPLSLPPFEQKKSPVSEKQQRLASTCPQSVTVTNDNSNQCYGHSSKNETSPLTSLTEGTRSGKKYGDDKTNVDNQRSQHMLRSSDKVVKRDQLGDARNISPINYERKALDNVQSSEVENTDPVCFDMHPQTFRKSTNAEVRSQSLHNKDAMPRQRSIVRQSRREASRSPLTRREKLRMMSNSTSPTPPKESVLAFESAAVDEVPIRDTSFEFELD